MREFTLGASGFRVNLAVGLRYVGKLAAFRLLVAFLDVSG
jgi:hypothetical protein